MRVSEKSRVMDSLRSSQEKDQSCRQAGSRIDESHKQRERLTFSMLTLLVVTRHISIGSMNLELSNKRHPWLHLVHIENATINIQKTFPTENNNGDARQKKKSRRVLETPRTMRLITLMI